MAIALKYHPNEDFPGHHVAGFPNVDHDEERLEHEALSLNVDPEEYARRLLEYRWPDGKPVFTVGDAAAKKNPSLRAAQEDAKQAHEDRVAAQEAEAAASAESASEEGANR